MSTRVTVTMVFSSLTLLGACTSSLESFEYKDGSRYFAHYAPEGLEEGAPLVFFLHGYMGYALEYQRQFGLDALADEHGFGVVYPQGTWDDNWVPHWNADLTISDVDDIGYLVALAESLQQTHGYEPERTYTSGISNGGFMSYTLACRAPNTFHAMGSIIGTMSKRTWEECAPEKPISVLQISGANDTVVPIDGSMDEEGGWGGAPPITDIVTFWSEQNQCTNIDTQTQSGNITSVHHTNCLNDNVVEYYEIDDMGHEIPSLDRFQMDAAEVLWNFLSKQ
mgnify:CR=1 FL=1